jgi:hypothetical protein
MPVAEVRTGDGLLNQIRSRPRVASENWSPPPKKFKQKASKKKDYIGNTVQFISNFKFNKGTVEKGAKAVVKKQYGKGVVVEIENKQGTHLVVVPFNKIKVKNTLVVQFEPFEPQSNRTELLGIGLQTQNGIVWRSMRQVNNFLEDIETRQHWYLSPSTLPDIRNGYVLSYENGSQDFYRTITLNLSSASNTQSVTIRVDSNIGVPASSGWATFVEDDEQDESQSFRFRQAVEQDEVQTEEHTRRHDEEMDRVMRGMEIEEPQSDLPW